jgi:hypothetical protein
LHESVVNRYCMLKAECNDFELMINELNIEIEQLKNIDIEPLDYITQKGKMQDRIMTCDRKIMEKRKMMLDIEKENIMTIASALRSIPKQPDKEKENSSMAAYMNRKRQ